MHQVDRSESSNVASGLQMGELVHHIGTVCLELWRLVKATLKRWTEGILWIHHEIADPRCHDKICNRDFLASGPLLPVMCQIVLHHFVIVLCDINEILRVLLFLTLGTKKHGGAPCQHIGERINDRISIASSLPILWIIVPILDTEHAKDGTHL